MPSAAAPQQYRVELLIFAHEPGARDVTEVFLADPPPELPDPTRALSEIDLSFTDRPDWVAILQEEQAQEPTVEALEEIVLPTWRQLLNPEHAQLDAIHRRLQRQQGYRPLMLMIWEQAAEVDAEAMVIDLSEAVLGSAEMIGTVMLSRSRFLHLNLNLEYLPADRAPPQLVATRSEPLAQLRLQVPRYRLTESRRLRSGEVHYFDHPAFGAIAVVTPVGERTTGVGNTR